MTAVLSVVGGGAPDRVDGFDVAYVTSDGAQGRVRLEEAWALRLECAEPVRRRFGPMFLRGIWDSRCYELIQTGTETTTFSASRVFAAVYPEAVDIAVILASPFWRKMAAGNKAQLARFVTEIGDRLADPYYQPRDNGDAIAHWIEDVCWRAQSPPATTFLTAPGHRKPSQLARARLNGHASLRHDNAVMCFTRKRRPGNVILHHRTVNPVLIREWSTPMEAFAGAIWQSQRTTKRFKTTKDPRSGTALL